MKKFIVYLLLGILLSSVVFPSFAQQNKSTPEQEIESLKKQLSELQGKLQTVENVEKMELTAKLAEAQAKLAEANAKLINTDIEKLKLELKESNHKWLIGWFLLFLAIIAAVGTPLWLLLKSGINKIISNLKSNADRLIVDEVEKRLDGFKEAVEKANILEPQVRILNKEHAATVLEKFINYRLEHYPEQVKELEEKALLDVFDDETRHLEFRIKAARVLANRKSERLVSSVLKCLSSYIESDFDWENYPIQYLLCNLINLVGYQRNSETYETFQRFLERLLTDNLESKRFIITHITFSLADVSSELNKKESVSIITKGIQHLEIQSLEEGELKYLVEYFDKFAEPEGIKEIYNIHAKDKMSDLAETCLNLLEKFDPDFVKKEREEKASTNTEGEETNESKPTE